MSIVDDVVASSSYNIDVASESPQDDLDLGSPHIYSDGGVDRDGFYEEYQELVMRR